MVLVLTFETETFPDFLSGSAAQTVLFSLLYRGADKSLARQSSVQGCG